ncbi:guanine nucleotide-binding protein g(o) subunit alpha [Anaeramoeba flamelloides]|uniref:Guanine nucleotide-binding protein g(O) subunit alpha n=1 Tax=Anaeramoeba flamelloides TaxID=1746091 RepID=A0ABQ8Y435_9EUKA|nr:guanine nucleotide-binding protein g(o) subunit alpha [Anaeramoeba flamelloides]
MNIYRVAVCGDDPNFKTGTDYPLCNCGKKPEKEQSNSKLIEKKLKKLRVVLDNEIKILLLGPGDSGKSTVVKQMRLINGLDFDQEEREDFVDKIRFNVIQNTRALVFAMDQFGVEYSDKTNLKSSKYFKSISPTNSTWGEDVYSNIKTLWKDQGIQEVFKKGSEFHLNDTSRFFFDTIDTINRNDYVPNNQDIICSRIKTTGISEIHFDIDDIAFRVLDVGGQRNERKKWIHCFQDVTALIFVVAISQYDQVLYEDETQNRMVESLQLFDEICNMPWFDKSSIILFLNKKDLFDEKIKRVDIKVAFKDYSGANESEEASKYIRSEFVKLYKNERKKVYPYFTCATDTSNSK